MNKGFGPASIKKGPYRTNEYRERKKPRSVWDLVCYLKKEDEKGKLRVNLHGKTMYMS